MSISLGAQRASVALANAAFVLAGISAGVGGVLLPSQIADYRVDNATIGITFFTFSAGFMLAGATSGVLIHRFGIRAAVVAGCGAYVLAALYTATRPPFAAFLAVQVVAGYGSGLLESALNAYLTRLPAATTLLNRLHAFFGVGALLGPLLAAWVLTLAPWPAVWLVLALLCLPLAAGFLAIYPRDDVAPRHHETITGPDAATTGPGTAPAGSGVAATSSGVAAPGSGMASAADEEGGHHAEMTAARHDARDDAPHDTPHDPLRDAPQGAPDDPPRDAPPDTPQDAPRDVPPVVAGSEDSERAGGGLLAGVLRAPALLLASALLSVYVGLEVSVGNWGFTFLVHEHAQQSLTAGYTVSGYWLGLTLGRFLISPAATRIGLTATGMVFMCMVGIIAGAALTWLAPGPAVAGAGFVLLGFFLGPVFPTVMAVVPRLTAARLVPTAIGVLNGMSVIGGAALPWLAGVIAQGVGLWTLMVFALVLALLQLVLWQLVVARMAGGRA
ncbi:MFS transporter [Sphaerisporangium dianthi]|uniref:MFS transporter n=1 Tax=Sphaerisporangium dianthi TaxID=1436120 RepID=A0ABV9CIJ6_9ACTN